MPRSSQLTSWPAGSGTTGWRATAAKSPIERKVRRRRSACEPARCPETASKIGVSAGRGSSVCSSGPRQAGVVTVAGQRGEPFLPLAPPSLARPTQTSKAMLLDGVAGYLADAAGASPDQIKVILLLVGSVPLSLAYPYFPPSTRSPLAHLYSLVPSVVFLCFVLDLRWGFLQLLASSLATWVIVKVGVAQKWGAAMPWAVFTLVMGHLAVNHILRHLDDTPLTTIEITGSQMVLCMKLISFAWSAYDGTRPLEQLDATQKASRIEGVPGLLPFLGYACVPSLPASALIPQVDPHQHPRSFFFPSILAGPSFTYRSYDSFTSHRLFIKENPSGGADPTVIPPGRRRKAAKRFATGIFFLAIFSLYSGSLGMDKLIDPKFTAGKSWFEKVRFMNVAGFIARTKYYSVWCIAESAFIISGLGYNPQTKHYDASRNVRIRSIEFAPNFKVLLDSWNMNTNVWLRECIYKRVAKKGRKPGFKSTQITFITSALWHGVNPCYLMTFVLGGFCQALNRSLRAGLRPFFLPPGALQAPNPLSASPPPLPKLDVLKPAQNKVKGDDARHAVKVPGREERVKLAPPPQTPLKIAYDVVGTLATQAVLNFAVVPFLLLDVHSSLTAWRAVSFYGLVLVFAPFVALNLLGGLGALKRLQRRRDARARTQQTRGGTREVEEEERERRRVEWERGEEVKRRSRGEGVPSLGIDVEELVEEEEREEARREAEAAAAAAAAGKKAQ
ncbi:MBOAT, membrane-bound O-acyltransferase family-domain-containing protein [Rhodotorula diobovata]|uniref:MBOAT, membrane-bound O-acyltransferase family-domain-containing protein n=1 Tax=Rhodotorula diobovata TaxID=5288 RepID=A0A5C5FT46_9BASI|nr:MBOAT, membrane-bound O-acyltransferase family-domain-containing protein [Rhodotorula diobovata]